MTDSYLFDAGWLFFAVWSVVIAVVSVWAFGRDLIPFQPHLEARKADTPQIDPSRESWHR